MIEISGFSNSAGIMRYMFSAKNLTPVDVPHDENTRFLDSYVLEFIDPPDNSLAPELLLKIKKWKPSLCLNNSVFN
jgi:hypothetical protein